MVALRHEVRLTHSENNSRSGTTSYISEVTNYKAPFISQKKCMTRPCNIIDSTFGFATKGEHQTCKEFSVTRALHEMRSCEGCEMVLLHCVISIQKIELLLLEDKRGKIEMEIICHVNDLRFKDKSGIIF